MIHSDDDAGESLLAPIDLHAWRVPPATTVHRASNLLRTLSPATTSRRPRMRWLVAGIVLFNAAIAAILLVVLTHASTQTSVTVLPGGGGSVDAQVRELRERLQAEERELESKLAEIHRMQALIDELDAKIQQYERQVRDLTVIKPHKTPTDRPIDRPIDDRAIAPGAIAPGAIAPDAIAPETGADNQCDEVSCVLGTSSVACCAKYRKLDTPTIVESRRDDIPESLDRNLISAGVAGVKSRVQACGVTYPAKGKVKASVRVGANGRVTNVVIVSTPDAKLGACVAGVMQRATFGRTHTGGSFTYPFVF